MVTSTVTCHDADVTQLEADRNVKHFPQYGSINCSGDTCPTCCGTGRIPRGHENQLVAVIPCNDVRLKPRRTKLYVSISMVLCLFLSCLILFFLFPRSVTLAPVSVESVTVYFVESAVQVDIKNLVSLSNNNFVPVKIVEFNVQGLVQNVLVGKTKICNMTSLQSRSHTSYIYTISLPIEDVGLNTYCRSSVIKIHSLFVQLQLTLNISYLSHTEQLTLETYEYIDCGSNSTIPHPVR